MNYIQLYFDLPLTKVYVSDREKYIKALQGTRDKEDLNIFRDFMTNEQLKFFKEKIEEYKASKRKSRGFKFLF